MYLSPNKLLLVVPVRINLSSTHCGACQLLQSDIIHPPSHIFPLVTPSGLASVNYASQTPHAFCCTQSCDTVYSSFPLQCEGSQLGQNCPPTTLSLNLVLPFVYQILTSFLEEFLVMFLSFVYSLSHKSGVGMCLGHAQSLLHCFVPQESWAGLMCSWKSSSWMTGRKQRRGVRDTEDGVSACLRRTLRISAAVNTCISVGMEPSGSLTRDSTPRNTTHSFHSFLDLQLKSLFTFHAYGAQSALHPLLQFYSLFGWEK